MRKPTAIVTTLVAGFALTLPASAAAGGGGDVPHHDTEITIDFVGDEYGGAFYGNVISDKAKCFKNRLVKVKTTDEYGSDVVGTTSTDREGDYAIVDEAVEPAEYFAIAKKRVVRKPNGERKFVCERARSETIFAP